MPPEQPVHTMYSIFSRLRALKRIPWLRSAVYLVHEAKRSILDSPSRDREIVECEYGRGTDPYECLSGIAAECYAKQLQALDAVCVERTFGRVLEIGCSEGVFTELLAPRCGSLLAVDLSPIAISRAAARGNWEKHVSFGIFDLRRDPIPGRFDVIVVSGVLEYIYRPTVLWAVRNKLVDALAKGGFLLVDTTRANPVVEEAWWSKVVLRGVRINRFFEQHADLQFISRDSTKICYQTLFKRI